jgi:hypothetical protein
MQEVNNFVEFHNSDRNKSATFPLPASAVPRHNPHDREHSEPDKQERQHRLQQLEDQPDARGDGDDHRKHPDDGIAAEIQR